MLYLQQPEVDKSEFSCSYLKLEDEEFCFDHSFACRWPQWCWGFPWWFHCLLHWRCNQELLHFCGSSNLWFHTETLVIFYISLIFKLKQKTGFWIIIEFALHRMLLEVYTLSVITISKIWAIDLQQNDSFISVQLDLKIPQNGGTFCQVWLTLKTRQPQ